jgi:hypothetical protein
MLAVTSGSSKETPDPFEALSNKVSWIQRPIGGDGN